ncbi:hypothetical protein QBC43DRAFT_70194 [Cladorrhinum sp. PSN259]|nr:hypothetical protein QBC43DRAFT_70194 [Cladorrhinum sp. PSN259]
MSARFPQYASRRPDESLHAYSQRANAQYASDWALKAREQMVQRTARLSTPEDQDDAAILRSIEADAAVWKLPDDDLWLTRNRLAYGGQPPSRPQPRQLQYNHSYSPLNLEYPDARSLTDCESDSGAESDHLMPDCDNDNDNFSSEPPSEPTATQPLRNKRHREDEEDITNDIKRHKTEPLVDVQPDPTRMRSKRRRDNDITDEERPMHDLKRPRIQTETDTEPALAPIPSPTSYDILRETQNDANSTPERPAHSPKIDIRNADRVQRRKHAPGSSTSLRNDQLLEKLLRGPRITRRSGLAQLCQLDDRGRPMLQRTAPRIARPSYIIKRHAARADCHEQGTALR